MHVPKKVVLFFEASAVIALMVSLAIFISSFFIDIHHHGLEIIEGGVVTIFLMEVGVQLAHTDNKKKYLKQNWFYILTILPLVGIFKALRLGKFTQFVKVFQLFQHTKILKSEAMAAKMGFGLLFSKEALSMIYHISRADFTSVPRILKTEYIDMIISNDASIAAVEGIKKGIRDFFKEAKKKVVFHERYVENVPTDLSIQRKRWTLFLSNEDVMGFSIMSGRTGLISTNLKYETSYKHIPFKDMEYIRGYTVGFNAFARLKRPCFCRTCIHKKLNQKRLDVYSFLTYVHQRVPRCEIHN
ncbi:MAG: hypothetical protein ACLFP2_04530 [Candidatus Woesearchaeota archaeon]